MLPFQFFGQNLHFAINLFTALVFFAVFWLYFDAWLNKKVFKELFEWLGAILVSVSFLMHGILIEQSVLGSSIFHNKLETLSLIMRLLGYIGLILGQTLKPLQKTPDSKPVFTANSPTPANVESNSSGTLPAVTVVSKVFGLVYIMPITALGIGYLYFRRATTGLERHLKPVAYAFLLFSLSEIFALARLFRNTDNPQIYNLLRAFGPAWIIELIFLLAGSIVLGRWVWKYLMKRFLTQLFMIFIVVTMSVFLLTTASFTFLLTKSIQDKSLDNLETAAQVLQYALLSKKAETKANAEAAAENPRLIEALASKNYSEIYTIFDSYLSTKKVTSLVITNANAQVVHRAEDPDRKNDSVSSDTLVRRALVGQSSSTITNVQGVLAPVLTIRSAVPVRDGKGTIVGTVSASVVIDNALVDGIKNTTGLDSAIYSGNTLSATTLKAPDGKTRQIGIKQTNSDVNNTVIKNEKTFKRPLTILNLRYLAVYVPLKNVDNKTVGMLFIGQPQSSVLKTAGRSIELTFLVSTLLLLLSIIPAYFTAKYLAYQLE